MRLYNVVLELLLAGLCLLMAHVAQAGPCSKSKLEFSSEIEIKAELTAVVREGD